ncbi:MAG: hypothetical protein ACXVA9_06400 [Bdellovibrionales bacterium]
MSLILYAQLVFGILFVIRTLQIFRARALLSTITVTKTGTAFVFASMCTSFFGTQNLFSCSILISSCVFLTIAALFLLERREIDSLKSEVPLFLDRWILNLRLGSALPTARETALRDHSSGFQTLMRPVFTTQTAKNGRQNHLLLATSVMFELEHLQHEPHSALSRLENLRQLLRKSAEFRRKSGQATRQTAIQSSVMMILLFALMMFTLHRYGWKRSGDLILGSAVLSLIGVLVMYLLSRKTKWKI